MASYTGTYRAKAVMVNGGVITAYVPQVFGDTPVTITDAIGGVPTGPTMGWVFFESGWPEFPVWASGQVSGNGAGGGAEEVAVQTEDPGLGFDLWYDTDAVQPSGTSCPICGCLVLNQTLHDEWHVRQP